MAGTDLTDELEALCIDEERTEGVQTLATIESKPPSVFLAASNGVV
jgi:hypothetical protein